MFDFLKNWGQGLASLPGSIFDTVKDVLRNPGFPQQQQQQIISPLPDEYSRFTAPPGTTVQTPPWTGNSIPNPFNDLASMQPGYTDNYSYDPNNISAEARATVEKYGGGGGIDELIGAIVDPVSQALDKWRSRLEEFDRNNPFAFDEAQAKASAAERLNPYYDATLNEFMTGIRRSSARSVEDMTRTVGELNVDASKLSEKERFNTQEAIRSSEEGFAGAGLFFSGKRARATGVNEVQGLQTQEGIQTGLERNTAAQLRNNARTQEDLALQEARTKRLTEAERTTALETDVAKQQREAEIRRAQERLAYAGPAPGSSFTNQFSTQNQLYGLY